MFTLCCFNDFCIFKYALVEFCLTVVGQYSQILQHKGVTNDKLLKTVNISEEPFLKGYWVFTVTLCLLQTIHIILFKSVSTAIDASWWRQRPHLVNEDSSDLFSDDVASLMSFIKALFRSWTWSIPISGNLQSVFWKMKSSSMKKLCSCGEFWGRANRS